MEYQTLRDGGSISLENLDERQLKRLMFEESAYGFQRVLDFAPFSEERGIYLNRVYAQCHILKRELQERENGVGGGKKARCTAGANELSLHLCSEVVRNYSGNGIFFECGCGSGYVIESLAEQFENLEIAACDVDMDKRLVEAQRGKKNVKLIGENVYRALDKIEDNSIGIFYADNVFEHFFPDELDETMNKICRKMEAGGIMISVIPNRLDGPHDISRWFLERGEKPICGHYLEQTQREWQSFLSEKGLSSCFVYRFPHGAYRYVRSRCLNAWKLKLEPVWGNYSSNRLVNKLGSLLGYTVYVSRLEKRDPR